MPTVSTPRTTAYKEFVFSNLPSIVRGRGGQYTYDELAALVGLKPTHNFRKRVRELVAEGQLMIVPTFSLRNNVIAMFKAVTHNTSEERPF